MYCQPLILKLLPYFQKLNGPHILTNVINHYKVITMTAVRCKLFRREPKYC